MDRFIDTYMLTFTLAAIGAALWVLRGQKHKKPNLLNFRKKRNLQPEPRVRSTKNNNGQSFKFTEKPERELSCIFMFNGHAYDAYEVLGIPAGTSIKEAKLVFKSLCNGKDEATQKFLRLALEALEK